MRFDPIGKRGLLGLSKEGGEETCCEQPPSICRMPSAPGASFHWFESVQIERGSNKSLINPLLSTKRARFTPILSSRLRWRLASGVGLW